MSERAAQIQARILREGLSKYPRNVHKELLADEMGTVNGVLGEMVRRIGYQFETCPRAGIGGRGSGTGFSAKKPAQHLKSPFHQLSQGRGASYPASEA